MSKQIENAAADGYGLQEAAPPGTLAWHVCLFSPAVYRSRVRALFAYRAELDRAANLIAEKDIARIRLGWWREEVVRYSGGDALHPVCKALSEESGQPRLDPETLNRMIDAAEAELTQTRYPEIDDLLSHCAKRGGSFLTALCRLSVASDDTREIPTPVDAIGGATALVEMIRDLRHDAPRGQVFVPLEWLDSRGLTVSDLDCADPSQPVREIVRLLGEQAADGLDLAGQDTLPAAASVFTALHSRLLLAMSADDYRRIFRERIALGGMQMLWHAWRAAIKGSTSKWP